MFLERRIQKDVISDLRRKMVFIAGPRQVGKTALAKHILNISGFDIKERYFLWENPGHKRMMSRQELGVTSGMVVLDEIHKFKLWRQTVKGIYDLHGPELQILVTGSAKLNHYRKGGDSLQGRYHFHRLFPLTVKETGNHRDALDTLLQYGGFPEPFLSGSKKQARRWSLDYQSLVIREDLRDLENVRDISLIELLAMRLPELVGSPLSLNSLREDLQVAHQTVSRWVTALENLYVLFRIYPFGAPKIRAVKKESKHYHFDWTSVASEGARFENLVACHLFEMAARKRDNEGIKAELRFFRDTDGREVDFVTTEEGLPTAFIEVKISETTLSSSLSYLKAKFPEIPAFQLLRDGTIDKITKEGVRICTFLKFITESPD